MHAAPVVLDNGTATMKCGLAGTTPVPLLIAPTVLRTCREPVESLRTRFSDGSALRCWPLYGGPCLHSSMADKVLPPQQQTQPAAVLNQQRPRWCDVEALCNQFTVTPPSSIYPVSNGVVCDMDAMQELWNSALCEYLPLLASRAGICAAASERENTLRDEADHCSDVFDEGLRWLQERQLLLSEPPNTSTHQRCQIGELFFEYYGIPALQTSHQAILALFANGAESGVVLECGEGLSHCTPVLDGVVLSAAQRSVGLAGRAVTERLGQALVGCSQRMLQPIGGNLHVGADPLRGLPRLPDDEDLLRRVKERYCYVAAGVNNSDKRRVRDATTVQCELLLPDGAACRLGRECWAAAEVLFRPQEAGREGDGLGAVLWHCIDATDIDVRTALYKNIVLSGGTTALPGFGERLTHELQMCYTADKWKGDTARMARCPIQVKAPQRRYHLVYTGGALLAELSLGQPEAWLSKSAYEEGGTAAIIAYHQVGADKVA